MMDYKKYSLENLEKWLQDAISCSEATPQEIYDVIKNVVSEEYEIYKNHTERCYELLALLNGNGIGHLSCDKDDKSSECQKAWASFWEENYYPEEHSQYSEEDLNSEINAIKEEGGYGWTPEVKKDKVIKWQLPVEVDDSSGEYFVSFPDDLLEAADLKEGEQVEWIDNGDGSFTLKKTK